MNHPTVNEKTLLCLQRNIPPVDQSPVTTATDSQLMNKLQTASGRSDKKVLDKILFDLVKRHAGLVLNILRAEKVPAHDVDFVSGRVWETINRVAHKPTGSKGAWDPSRGFGGACPFVPFLKDVCRSRARDYHNAMKTQRQRRSRIEEAASLFGNTWQVHGGVPTNDHVRRKRGGNLKPINSPAAWNVVSIGKEMLADAMSGLPERQRRTLELYADGLSNEEIAIMMGTAPATVSRDLTRARGTIRDLVEAVAS